MTDTGEYRKERDSMGEFQVPISAYYGANTMRAVLNFPISDLKFSRSFIEAIATIKLAAAKANMELHGHIPAAGGAVRHDLRGVNG